MIFGFFNPTPILNFQVNNGKFELDRNGAKGESVCYTAVNPFHVQILSQEKRREVQLGLSSKRVKSPTKQACKKGDNRKIISCFVSCGELVLCP